MELTSGNNLAKTVNIGAKNMTKAEITKKIDEMVHAEHSFENYDIMKDFSDFDYENAQIHLANLDTILNSSASLVSIVKKGWFSSKEGAIAFDEIVNTFSLRSGFSSIRSEADIILSYITPQEWNHLKSIGAVDFVKNNNIDCLYLTKCKNLSKDQFQNLIKSGLSQYEIPYASDNMDINNFFKSTAQKNIRPTYFHIKDEKTLKALDEAIKKAAGNNPVKIKELTTKLQNLDGNLLETVAHFSKIHPDIEFLADNVKDIHEKLHINYPKYDDDAWHYKFNQLMFSLNRDNVEVFNNLITIKGLDQKQIHDAIAYADTPAKIHHLQTIIDKIKAGEELPIALPFVKHSEVNPRIAQAKYAQMPKFDATTKPETLLNTTKQGQVVAIGNKTYINDRGKMVQLDMSAETYEQLFPPYSSLCIQQGANTGDCYFLSGGLIAFMKNDYARIDLLKMIKQEGNDIVITFPGYPNHPVRFKNGELDVQTLQARTSKGNLLLEQAYAKAKYSANHGVKDASTVKADEAMNYISGGNEHIVFNEILGTNDSVQYTVYSGLEDYPPNTEVIPKNKMEELLNKYADKDNVLLTAGSGIGDDGNLPEYGVTPKHAYCIEKIDSQNKTVTIINPYNSLYCMTLSYDQFTQYFASLSVKELKTTV